MSLKGFISDCNKTLIDGTGQGVDKARDYLLKRSLLENSWNSHIIGYCEYNQQIPDAVRFFGNELREERWDMSGKLRSRLIVPVFDEFGKAIGLASRYPSFESGNVWWNLPKPFYKGNHLYLINKARKAAYESNKIYVVEGYADALMLHQEGLANVVALMGTALTLRKLGTIARYCNNICLAFDVDKNESGQKALSTSVSLLKKFDFYDKLSVINSMPVGQDPADYVKENGIKSFLEMEKVLSEEEIREIMISQAKQKNKDIIYAK